MRGHTLRYPGVTWQPKKIINVNQCKIANLLKYCRVFLDNFKNSIIFSIMDFIDGAML